MPALNELIVPFFKFVAYPLGPIGFIVLTFFVIVGTSNAVNLTYGLDGLAIMPTVMVGSALGIFAYVAGHAVFSKYLGLPYIAGAVELAVILSTLACTSRQVGDGSSRRRTRAFCAALGRARRWQGARCRPPILSSNKGRL